MNDSHIFSYMCDVIFLLEQINRVQPLVLRIQLLI